MIAEIVGVVESKKVYKVGKMETKLLLRLQLSTNEIQNLSMEMVSNQNKLGGILEITNWLDINKVRLPTVNDLTRKREDLEKGATTEISLEDINRNIMRNIEKVINKEREAGEGIASYLSFLRDKQHHIDIQIKETEYGFKDGTISKEKKGRFAKETTFEKPKIHESYEELMA